MELKTWTPLLDLERDLRTMFDRYWPAEASEHSLRLVTDMHRDDGELVVTVEMPGMDIEKDIDVSVEGDMLTIKGEKTEESEIDEEDRYLHERRFGRFERRIALPDGVDPDTVRASYEKGVLTVQVPLPEVSQPEARKIPVKAGS